MKLRSMLFVPADSERKLDKALGSRADALILDLEDAVAPARKPAAREAAAAFVAAQAKALPASLFVRINPLDSGLALDDLAAVVVPGLAGIMLPKTTSAEDVRRLGLYLDALESRAGMARGTVHVVPVATETAQAMLTMASFVPGIPRLAALTWGAEDLSAALGAISNREADGSLSPLYVFANSMCLCAAAAAGVDAIDTLHADFRDGDGLAAACAVARRRGFRGKIAIHPDQVDIINEAFTPSEAEIAAARRIVDAFAAQPQAGTLSFDGVMVDLPHLKQARRTLGLDD
ncbi:HpcH/HpaI aldolase/citrate lyase family protein [Paraburkholderia elongata]|uniref:CoA ester lyase n=1 Tax=Paraburkholderia elongata TaxID=2675747 RepID=A0A972NP95_9BURK|nr:CoA ester lyase [Paraburkholderia elongata]NPT57081.1 CoA ester lyase [Paraburkholderia elongata]